MRRLLLHREQAAQLVQTPEVGTTSGVFVHKCRFSWVFHRVGGAFYAIFTQLMV